MKAVSKAAKALPRCNRAVAFTALNAQSSRSHGIVMLTIVKRPSSATPKDRAVGQKVKVGRLFMVDLAGSERLKKSRSTGGTSKSYLMSLERSLLHFSVAEMLQPLCRSTAMQPFVA